MFDLTLTLFYPEIYQFCLDRHYLKFNVFWRALFLSSNGLVQDTIGQRAHVRQASGQFLGAI